MHDLKLLPLLVLGTLVVSVSTFAVVISLVMHKQRQVKNRLARQKMEFDYGQALLNTRLEVQEITLNMLAHELHDNITQSLTGCYMQFNIAATISNDEAKETILGQAKENLLGIISNVRLLSHSLATSMIEERNLEDAIKAELDRIQTFSNINCLLQSESLHELEPEQRLIVFRIVQEALQNTLKHARAKNITISIDEIEENYRIRIADDGQGFDNETAVVGGSLGLKTMQERVMILKGEWKLNSVQGKGTTIDLRVPLSPLDGKDKSSNRR